MFDPVFNWIITLALMQLFTAAVWHKLSDMDAFSEALRAYDIVPTLLEKPVAIILLIMEVLAVVLLMVPAFREIGALLACTLLLVYALAMAINLARGRQLANCGCHFGQQSQPVTRFLVVRNLVLALGGSMLLWPEVDRQLNLVDFGCILFGLSVVALIYFVSNSLSQSYTRLQQAIAKGDL